MKQRTPQSAYVEAASLCARGEQCSADILARLIRWGISLPDAHDIVKRLVNERFIDDSRFARAYARDKAHFQAWGKTKIRYNLRAKGIPTTAIDDALAAIETPRYDDGMRRAITSKAKTLASREPARARAALYRFAASRGYELSQATPIINQCLNSYPDDDFFE